MRGSRCVCGWRSSESESVIVRIVTVIVRVIEELSESLIVWLTWILIVMIATSSDCGCRSRPLGCGSQSYCRAAVRGSTIGARPSKPGAHHHHRGRHRGTCTAGMNRHQSSAASAEGLRQSVRPRTPCSLRGEDSPLLISSSPGAVGDES